MRRYEVNDHAIDRTVERLGIMREHARNYLNQLMQTAYYTGDTTYRGGTSRVFDHYKNRVRIIVHKDCDRIITVYRFPDETFADEIKRTIQRTYRKAKQQFTRNKRTIMIEIAELNVEIAQLSLNKVKAKSPKVQSIIQSKIESIHSKINELQSNANKIAAEFERVKRGAQAWMD